MNPTSPPRRRPSQALRDDCWSDDSTHALIEAWGSRHLSLNRGNLRQHHWQEVAAAVNSTTSTPRTDIQCKNRIDTLKKKYKVEKSKLLNYSGNAYVSPWRFFSRLDFLLSPPPANSPVPSKFPVGRRSSKPKRPASIDGSFFRRNFEVVIRGGDDECEGRREREEEKVVGVGEGVVFGYGRACREVAEAIRRLGEVYERVEGMKQEQMIELEKHRMQFAKDLEFQRMKLFMDTQLQLARIKRTKHSHDVDSYL